MGLMGGQTLGNVIWFYLQAFLSLYLYFAVIGMIDTASTAEELKITLADFLENRMSERLAAFIAASPTDARYSQTSLR